MESHRKRGKGRNRAMISYSLRESRRGRWRATSKIREGHGCQVLASSVCTGKNRQRYPISLPAWSEQMAVGADVHGVFTRINHVPISSQVTGQGTRGV